MSLLLVNTSVLAEPRTSAIEIISLRALASGAVLVQVEHSQNMVTMNDGSTCNANFRVENGPDGRGEAIIGTLFLAYGNQQPVVIEIPTGTAECGFGTDVQSVILSR